MFIGFSIILCIFTFLLSRSFSDLSKDSVELFWATLNFILASKKLLGSSLGSASGFWRAHNHSTDFMDRNFGALGDLPWSLLGAPETSIASKPDAQSFFEHMCLEIELSTAQFEL